MKLLNFDRIMGVIALITIVIAWIVGFKAAGADLLPSVREAMPEAERIELEGDNIYAGWAQRGDAETLVGYVKIASAKGYGGPVSIAVAGDLNGNVIGISIADHKETPSYFKRILSSDLIDSLFGKSYTSNFTLGGEIDAVTGATRSSNAVVQSVYKGIREIAKDKLGFKVPEEQKPQIKFGIPEIVIIALFIIGIIGRRKSFKFKKTLRWVSIIAGLIIIGFLYNIPLTISMINQLLLGFLPEWQTTVFWFLLIFGIIILFIIEKKNVYCNWFCPFGAAQECLGTLGKARSRSPGRFRGLLKWLRRILVWIAIILALLSRNPGLSSYEVFGTLFNLVGSTFQFVLLGIVLVSSLFIFRPWCNYLCPLRPVNDYFLMLRRWMRDIWQKMKPNQA